MEAVHVLIPGGLFLDDADRDVRALLRHLPRGAQPAAQVRGKTPQDGFAGDGRRRSDQDRDTHAAAAELRCR